jgi:hypothetical protein
MLWLSNKSKSLQNALNYRHNRPLTSQEVNHMIENLTTTNEHFDNLLTILEPR